MKCSRCDTEISDDSRFCSKCGKYDIIRRLDESQEQPKRLLGTPKEHKFYRTSTTSHHAPRLERIKEVTVFLDRYLGKVK